MAGKGKVRVGIIGSQFEADIHAASFQIMPEEAEIEDRYFAGPPNLAQLRSLDSLVWPGTRSTSDRSRPARPNFVNRRNGLSKRLRESVM